MNSSIQILSDLLTSLFGVSRGQLKVSTGILGLRRKQYVLPMIQAAEILTMIFIIEFLVSSKDYQLKADRLLVVSEKHA